MGGKSVSTEVKNRNLVDLEVADTEKSWSLPRANKEDQQPGQARQARKKRRVSKGVNVKIATIIWGWAKLSLSLR